MRQVRLNAYHIMWLFVFFDLPVETPKQRKYATDFRKSLLKDGFTMMQYSVYTRHCASLESAQAHTKKIEKFLKGEGKVSILMVTDKQFGLIKNYWGKKETPLDKGKQGQLEFF